MIVDPNELKEFILDSGLASREEVEAAEKQAAERGTRLSDALVSQDILSDDELRRAQAYILGVPFVNLKEQPVDYKTLSLIPEPVARNHNIVAFNKTDKGLEVAMLDTDDLQAIDFVKKKVGMRILPRLTDKESIKAALKQYQQDLKTEFGDIIREAAGEITPMEGEAEEEVDEARLKELAEDLPVVRIVDALIDHAISQDASDIHIEPRDNEVLVRYRIDGILHDAMALPKNAASGIVARIKVLADLKLDEKRLPQDGRFRIERNDEKVSFRVSTLPTYYGEKVVMRILREDIKGYTLEGLGFHGKGLEDIHAATRERTGMILATGPTGSGKTTTLYTVLEILNTPKVNISTIEDPIEYQLPRINQTQVKPDIGLTFANGLRALVRQDPDILMVGEIRDNETAALAVNAALTGHLVLSTLHTNSAAGAVPRLAEMGVEPFLLTSSLKVVVAQRLVRVLCREREERFLSEKELSRLRESADLDRVLEALRREEIVGPHDDWPDIPFYKEKPSSGCEDGFSGRLGIHEIMDITPGINELISKNATADEIEAQARAEGMLTMLEDGVYKAAAGITTLEEVFRVVSE